MNSDKKLAVVYIITKLELGGAQKVCLALFNQLATSDMTTFLISGSEGKLVEQVQDNKQAILFKNLVREVSWRAIVQELKNFWTLVKTIRSLKQQYPHLIVHTHSTKAGIVGRWAAFCARVQHRIHTIHGFAFHEHQSKIKWLIIYFAEFFTSLITTHFVCVSSADVETGNKLFPWFAHKHSIIRAAVAYENFYIPARRTELFSAETFIFGTVACFKPQKNIVDLLKAFEYVYQKHPHIRLEIVGDGAQRLHIEQWIADHQLQEAITLHGWQDQVAPIMMQWHAFVLSSLWEGLPCAIIEARLLQLPIIAYDTGGIRDVIFHGKNGLLCKQQWQDLAQSMLTISINKTLYTTLQTYPDRLESFHTDTMIMHHKNLYETLR